MRGWVSYGMNTGLARYSDPACPSTSSVVTFIHCRMPILEVDNRGDVRDLDVVDLLGLNVHEDQATSSVIGVLDLRQPSDDLGHYLVNFVI